MGIFGWSYPPGCHSVPGDEEQAIDLSEGKTIKGYGRIQHGLCGKDADLDYGGQLKVESAYWLEDGTITAQVEGYASITPEEPAAFIRNPKRSKLTTAEKREFVEYMNISQELVCGTGFAGEWDGDCWIFYHTFSFKFEHPWNDEASDEVNIDAACQALVKRIWDDPEVKAFQSEMEYVSKALDLEQFRKDGMQ